MSRHLGICVRVVVVVVIAAVVSFRSLPQARAQDTDAPLELDGTGSFDVSELVSAWGTPMFESSSPVNLSYIAVGDRDGRTQLSLGQVDFAISGMPLTDEDKARLAARSVDVVSAPIAMASMAFLYAWPAPPNGLKYFTPDPTDPDGGGVTTQYSGPITMSDAVLGQTMAGFLGYRIYQDPDFLAQFNAAAPAGGAFNAPSASQWAVARSDPGAANYYLEQFLTQFSGGTYNGHLAQQNIPANTLSESWPLLDMPSRAGSKSVADLISSWFCPCGLGLSAGGSIGPTDQSTAVKSLAQQELKRTDPANNPGVPTPLSIVQVQNGAGEFVGPTPDSITKAAAAGGGQPLYGLKEAVPGAYPFTWTTNIYVPSTGLTVEKTNALATFIRYAAGPGQGLAASVNDGMLPDALRADAKSKADDIVRSNCKAAGGTPKADPTGGPYWPTGAAVPAGGTLLCVAPASPTTTTTAAVNSATSTGSVSDSGLTSGFGATSFGSSGGGSSTPSSSYSSGSTGSDGLSGADEASLGSDSSSSGSGGSGVSGPSGGAGSQTAQAAAATLPLKPPDDGQFALDRFATILLGALAFLVVRSFVRPRLIAPTR